MGTLPASDQMVSRRTVIKYYKETALKSLRNTGIPDDCALKPKFAPFAALAEGLRTGKR